MTGLARLLACMLLAAVLGAWGGCKRTAASADPNAEPPSLRLYAVSTLAGAIEPCGCVKDMLGGVDHAAALVENGRKHAPHAVVVGAGPLFFMDPELKSERRAQDLWKAEAIAASLKDIGLTAWAPGLNDWGAGGSELGRLAKAAAATPLAGNVDGYELTRVVTVGGYKVGIAGSSQPEQSGRTPEGVKLGPARDALERASRTLKEQGSQIRIALVAVPRGEALRLAEAVPDFHVMVVGKPYDQGEANDGPTPPVLVGDTLVVQPPNHLQSVAIVDFYVKDASFRFQDGTGVGDAERRLSLERRIAELKARIADWEKPGSKVRSGDLEARREDLKRLESELGRLAKPTPVEHGSYFRYELAHVVERLGSSSAVASRLAAYYRRVNDHNKVAFADRTPAPVPEGKSGYIGIEQCSSCHAEEREFWNKTGHSHAYVTLEKQHKQFNLDCVSCHVTGYDQPGGSTVTHVKGLTAVQCETCHGPGSRHVKDPKNTSFILKSPPRTLCAPQCHHPPHVKATWTVDEAWKGIIGPGHGR